MAYPPIPLLGPFALFKSASQRLPDDVISRPFPPDCPAVPLAEVRVRLAQARDVSV
jgi:hypothetical protein